MKFICRTQIKNMCFISLFTLSLSQIPGWSIASDALGSVFSAPAPTGNDVFDQSYEISYRWLEGPAVGRNKINRVEFLFHKKDNLPLAITRISFFPFMKIHGHGGRGEPILRELVDGRAVFDSFGFTMSGQWELEIRVELNGEAFALSLPVQVR